MLFSRFAAGVLAALIVFAAPYANAQCPSPTHAQFGFNTRPIAPGVRPLLTILVDFTDAPINPARGADYYQRILFGTATSGGRSASVNAMYHAASNGAVSFTNAGIVSVAYPGQPAADGSLPADFSQQVLRLADAAMRASGGRTFASFDRNRNGTIDNSELMIVRVSNSPVYRDLGATGVDIADLGFGDPLIDSLRDGLGGAASVLFPGGLRFVGQLSGVDEEMDLNGIAHELLHAFGNDDHIYGPGFSLNMFGSFFAGSYTASPRPGLVASPGAIALDPYTRMRSGWLRPRLVRLDASGAARLRHYGDSADNDTLLLYDPMRCDEFFLAEFRNPSRPLAAVDRGAGGVSGSAGIILWYVKRAADFSPYQFNWPPPIRGPYADTGAPDHMVANYMIGPLGAAAYSNLIWNTPEYSPPWGDLTPTNVGFEAFFTPSSDAADLSWHRVGGPFNARIETINGVARPPPLPAAGPAEMVLVGQFPSRQGSIVAELINLRGRTPLFIAEYGATRVVVRTRGAVPAGAYQVHLTQGAPRVVTTRGNQLVTFN